MRCNLRAQGYDFSYFASVVISDDLRFSSSRFSPVKGLPMCPRRW